jgi:hypothetical protein
MATNTPVIQRAAGEARKATTSASRDLALIAAGLPGDLARCSRRTACRGRTRRYSYRVKAGVSGHLCRAIAQDDEEASGATGRAVDRLLLRDQCGRLEDLSTLGRANARVRTETGLAGESNS